MPELITNMSYLTVFQKACIRMLYVDLPYNAQTEQYKIISDIFGVDTSIIHELCYNIKNKDDVRKSVFFDMGIPFSFSDQWRNEFKYRYGNEVVMHFLELVQHEVRELKDEFLKK